jgi:hypothetical protein
MDGLKSEGSSVTQMFKLNFVKNSTHQFSIDGFKVFYGFFIMMVQCTVSSEYRNYLIGKVNEFF